MGVRVGRRVRLGLLALRMRMRVRLRVTSIIAFPRRRNRQFLTRGDFPPLSSFHDDHFVSLNNPVLPSPAHLLHLSSQQALLLTSLLADHTSSADLPRRFFPFAVLSNVFVSLWNSSIARSMSSMDLILPFSKTFLLPPAETILDPPAYLCLVFFQDNSVFHLGLQGGALVLAPRLHGQQGQGWLLLSPPLRLLLLPLQGLQHLLGKYLPNSTKRLRETKPELFFPPLPSPFPPFFSARSPLPLSSFSFLGDILKTFVHRFAWFDIPPNYLNVFLTQTTKEPVEWFEDMEAKPSSISCSFFSCLSLLLFGSSSSFASKAEEGRVSLRFIFSSF